MINANNAYYILRAGIDPEQLKQVNANYEKLSGLAEKLQKKNRQTKKENR